MGNNIKIVAGIIFAGAILLAIFDFDLAVIVIMQCLVLYALGEIISNLNEIKNNTSKTDEQKIIEKQIVFCYNCKSEIELSREEILARKFTCTECNAENFLK